MPDFARRYFVGCTQIYEAYVERTLINLRATGGKSAAKACAREISRGYIKETEEQDERFI